RRRGGSQRRDRPRANRMGGRLARHTDRGLHDPIRAAAYLGVVPNGTVSLRHRGPPKRPGLAQEVPDGLDRDERHAGAKPHAREGARSSVARSNGETGRSGAGAACTAWRRSLPRIAVLERQAALPLWTLTSRGVPIDAGDKEL